MGQKRETELSNEPTSRSTRSPDLIESLPCGIQECDTEGIITFSSPAHCRMHGYADGELVGRPVWHLLDSDTEKDKLRSYISYLVQDQPLPTPYISRDLRKDGRWRRHSGKAKNAFECAPPTGDFSQKFSTDKSA